MHHQDYTGPWPWTYFTPAEIACRCGCGELWPGSGEMPDSFHEAMDALQELRELLGRPIRLNSAHRCADHNAAVGGAEDSQHLGLAFDCRCPADQAGFLAAAGECGFTGMGRYRPRARPPRSGFVHLDLGPTRYWEG